MPDNATTGEAGDTDLPVGGEREALELLERGALTVQGRIVEASNATLLCTIRSAGVEATCVYKPVAGERPLWDFPTGTLAGREVAAYLVSSAAGWNFVPPTVMRDGPFGPGMCQLWIDIEPDADLISLSRRFDHAGLRDMAVFDAVINNADRKIGHL
ncbi:MAG TPA: SCO1664 family protein, partial [Trebonia sp.]|nr:SCO1664 family protein [Trebonia sp.]